MILKKIKFKTLTMEIWITFIMMILIIVIGISLFNFIVLRNIENDRIFKDIEIVQNILLNGEFKGSFFKTSFDFKKFKEFKFIRHLLVEKKGNDSIILSDRFIDKKRHPEEREITKWMVSFIDEAQNKDGRFIEKFKDYKVFFLINDIELDDREVYIISYTERVNGPLEFTNFIYIALIFVIMGFIMSKIISSNLAKPLKQLEVYTESIAKKQWSEDLKLDRQDEIGRLAHAMNQMQIALKNADEEEKMFLQSISHDLKTPVMVIESYAQAIMDRVYIGSLEETALTIKDEANRLKHKIKKLLYLNSLNYTMKNEEANEEINVGLLLQDLYERFRLVKTDIKWEIMLEEVKIKGNMEKLRIALENILDNHIRYARNKISIESNRKDNRVIIEIYNDGPNINEENLTNIFDNFYKDKKGNFGLGLAICKRIIDFHNGNIFAKNHDVGVSFIIELPIE